VITTALIQDFIDAFDPSDPTDRLIAGRLRERLQGEIYRREREIYPEWVDHGGEA
jgi:hypothetical protein